jgi:O-antigen/teichoic acid export membrane protein
MGAMGLIAALSQIAYNYSVFLRAVNQTGPMFRLALLGVLSFGLITVPLIIAFGLTGYALGWGALTLIQVAGRCWYMARLFDGFKVGRHLARAIAPSVPAAAVVLLLRVAEPGHRSLPVVIAELVLYAGVTLGATVALERSLISEVASYLRGRARPAPAV